MNKPDLIKKIVAQLAQGLALYYHAARAARDEATHEQNKAENKYDTRGLEASYLARGQSRQAAETEKDIQQFESLVVRPFEPEEPIGLGALVELESKDGRSFYFVGPRAGGTEVVLDENEVLVITAQSPLGQQLLGKKQGDRFQFPTAGKGNSFRVVWVS